VNHIALETEDTAGVLEALERLGVPYAKNVSVPDEVESKPITQYFIRDPDGYYLEICDCAQLTDFVMGKSQKLVGYSELVSHVNLKSLFKLSFLGNLKSKDERDDLKKLILPEKEWAKEVDKTKLNNMLNRCKIYGDLMQGETEQSISEALRMSNNHVPRATRIIRAKKRGMGTTYQPPAYYIQGQERYQPRAVSMLTSSSDTGSTALNTSDSSNLSESDLLQQTIRKTFALYDTDQDGCLCQDDLKKVLITLRQNPDDKIFRKFFSEDKKCIYLEEFVSFIMDNPLEETDQWEALFKLLDKDGNGKITAPDMSMFLSDLGLKLRDKHIENLFIDADLDGDGYLNVQELKSMLSFSHLDE
jgi:Ca2+-binding EF-hand superfamily protein